jgi:hypothetical protein
MAKQRRKQNKQEDRSPKPLPKKAQKAVSRATADNKVTRSERRDIRQAVRSSGGSKKQAKATVKSAKQTARTAASNNYQNNSIGQFARTADTYGMGSANQGVFSGASWNQARDAGFTDDQIRDYLAGGNTGLMIGKRVQDVLDNYDQRKSPGVPDMPGMTDPRSGDEIGPSNASRREIFFSPVNMEGVNNMFGNPMSADSFNYSVVGDGINFRDPNNAEMLSPYTSRDARMRLLNSAYGMSSANPNLSQNMAAFIDSGHAESLLTGKTPTAMPSGYQGKFNPAMTGATTPWSQAYASQLAYKSPWMK